MPTPEHNQGILDGRESEERVELNQAAPALNEISPGARRRMFVAALSMLALMASTYLVPGFGGLQPWRMGEGYLPFWNVVGRELLDQGTELAAQGQSLAEFEQLARQRELTTETGEAQPALTTRPTGAGSSSGAKTGVGAETATNRYPAYSVLPAEAQPPKVGIENPTALEHFYGQLTLTELRKPGAITRASHWGDSVLGGDGLTKAIRDQMQARFGDAGHGFHALGRYNLSYLHRGVRYADRGGWYTCQIIFKCESDAQYGYAGVSSRSSGGGTSRWRTAKQGFGSSVSRFELWYATRPEGGRFQIKVDGEVARVVSTAADQPGDAVETLLVPDGEHAFEVRAIGGGVARGYGVVLERDEPGIVWDELSLIGSFTQRLDYQDPAHIARQVKRREVDLMVFMFGGNDVQRQSMDLYRTMQPYEDEYAAVLKKFRAGKPEASCLVMSLVDHGKRVGKYGIETLRIVPKLVESQRKVALQQGCAFFDTYAAMGGKGSIGRWYHASPRLANADFSHPTVEGQQVIGRLFASALMYHYAKFRGAKQGQPLPELSRQSEPLTTAGKPAQPLSAERAVDAGVAPSDD